jgi:hypothetical protein
MGTMGIIEIDNSSGKGTGVEIILIIGYSYIHRKH